MPVKASVAVHRPYKGRVEHFAVVRPYQHIARARGSRRVQQLFKPLPVGAARAREPCHHIAQRGGGRVDARLGHREYLAMLHGEFPQLRKPAGKVREPLAAVRRGVGLIIIVADHIDVSVTGIALLGFRKEAGVAVRAVDVQQVMHLPFIAQVLNRIAEHLLIGCRVARRSPPPEPAPCPLVEGAEQDGPVDLGSIVRDHVEIGRKLGVVRAAGQDALHGVPALVAGGRRCEVITGIGRLFPGLIRGAHAGL